MLKGKICPMLLGHLLNNQPDCHLPNKEGDTPLVLALKYSSDFPSLEKILALPTGKKNDMLKLTTKEIQIPKIPSPEIPPSTFF
jgi:hypothetical protein